MTFDPVDHGWRFVNSFRTGPLAYGLCGGMVYGALDYWRADIAIPLDRTPPRTGSRLWRYLVRRQLDAMPLAMLRRLAYYMRLNDRGLRHITHGECWLVRHAELPAPLVLIRARRLRDVTQNHQVLAVSADEDKLYLYDPNYPGQWAWLAWDSDNVTLLHSHDGPQRGMMVQECKAAAP